MTDTTTRPGALDRLDAGLGLIADLCRVLTGVALVALTAIFGWLVWGRYVLNATPTWVEQASFLLVMTIAFLGAAVGVRDNTHLAVALLRDAVPVGVRKGLVLLTDLLMAGFGGLMFWYGWELTAFKWGSRIPLLGLPEGLRSLPLTVGGALILLFSANHLLRALLGRDDRLDGFE